MRDPSDPFMDERAMATPTPSLTPSDHELRQQAIHACTMCDPDGYRGTTVCDHQPHHAQAAARGMNAIRAAMGWNTTTQDHP